MTLRNVTDQLPESVPAEYVPAIFSGSVVAVGDAAVFGNVSVTVALAPGARFVIAGGTVVGAVVPSVVPPVLI